MLKKAASVILAAVFSVVFTVSVFGAEKWSGIAYNISETEMTRDLVCDGKTDNLPPETTSLLAGNRYYFNLAVTPDISVYFGLLRIYKDGELYTYEYIGGEEGNVPFTFSEAGSYTYDLYVLTEDDKVYQTPPEEFTVALKPKKSYELTVKNGSGGGSYAENAEITVKANKPPEGEVFTGWTATGITLTETQKNSATVKIKMPAKAARLKANYGAAKAVKPVFSEPPKDVTVYADETDANYALLKVSVQKVSNNKFSYQWQYSDSRNGGWTNIAGTAAKKQTYKAPVKKSGKRYYRCVVTATDERAEEQYRTAKTTSKVFFVDYSKIDFTYKFKYKGKTETVKIALPRDVSKTLYPAYDLKYRQSKSLLVKRWNYDYNCYELLSDFSHYANNTKDDAYIKKIAELFGKIAEERGYGDYEKASYVAAFVQSLEYTLLVKNRYGSGTINEIGVEYPKFPLETLYDKGGDCEDVSILFCAIIKRMGYDAVLVNLPNHMAAGVSAKSLGLGGKNFTYNDAAYYFVECTDYWEIGSVPRECSGVSINCFFTVN